jgi:hypothetical protein
MPRRSKRTEPIEPPPQRDEAPTLTDPVELETARIRSTFSVPPPQKTDAPGSAESALLTAYETRFGGFARVPSIVMPEEQLRSQLLEGRAAMLVPLLDGRASIQEILDIGIVNPLDALAAIKELIERGIVRLK